MLDLTEKDLFIQQTNNYLNSFITQIKMADGYEPSMKWAFIGKNISDPLHGNPWENVFNYGGTRKSLINAYSRNTFIANYTGLSQISFVDNDILTNLKEDPNVKAMPCYPSDGSIMVYQDMVIIKLED